MDELQKILSDLATLVRDSIAIYRAANPGKALSFGLDCNVDYGQVYIAATDQPLPPDDTLFSEEGRDSYWFADWPSPNIGMEEAEIESMWTSRWEHHEDAISDWDELEDFDYEVLKQRFMEGVCQVAASLSRELGIAPILVANHDEHIRHTTARLAYAYGEPMPEHRVLVEGHWEAIEEGNMVNKLAFLTSGEAINHLIVDPEEDLEMTCELDWRTEPGVLYMTATQTNVRDADFLWKEARYVLEKLTADTLCYRDDEQSWTFKKKK